MCQINSRIILYNVGNRDITFKNVQNASYREMTEKILSSRNNIRENLSLQEYSLPIMTCLIQFLRKEYENLFPSRSTADFQAFQHQYQIILFATNQSSLHEKDTIFAAQILQHHLKQTFPVMDISINNISNNPADYDLMYKYFSSSLRGLKNLEKKKKMDSRVYLALGPGTPAMNAALIINGLELYGDKCEALYINFGEESFHELHLPYLLNAEKIKSYYNLLKERHYISAAIDLRQQYPEIKSILFVNSWENYLDEIEKARAAFDFQTVVSNLEKILKFPLESKKKSKFEKLMQNYLPLANAQNQDKKMKTKWNEEVSSLSPQYYTTSIAFLQEMLYNLKIKLEQYNYIDSIGRIFRLEEGLFRLLVEMCFNINTNNIAGTSDHFSNEIEQRLPLKAFLEQQKIRYHEPNHYNLKHMIKFIIENPSEPTYIQATKSPLPFKIVTNLIKIQKIDDIIEKFRDMRNQSILAHGFNSVSKKGILEIIDQYTAKEMDNLKKPLNQGENPNIITLFGKEIQQFRNTENIVKILLLFAQKMYDICINCYNIMKFNQNK